MTHRVVSWLAWGIPLLVLSWIAFGIDLPLYEHALAVGVWMLYTLALGLDISGRQQAARSGEGV